LVKISKLKQEGRIMTEVATAEQPTKQRKRVRKEDSTIKGSGVKMAGEWALCSNCGNSSSHLLVPPSSTGISKAAFCTYPCALGFVARKAQNDAQRDTVSAALAKLYNQPPNVVIPASDVAQLRNFGGKIDVAQWIPNYDFWVQHTLEHGVVAADASKSKRASKAAKPAAPVLEPGLSLIDLKGKIKRVEHLDGSEEAKKHGSSTVAGLTRKFAKFGAQHDTYTTSCVQGINGCVIVGYFALDAKDEDFNNLASQISGGSRVFGPALVFATRKMTIKA